MHAVYVRRASLRTVPIILVAAVAPWPTTGQPPQFPAPLLRRTAFAQRATFLMSARLSASRAWQENSSPLGQETASNAQRENTRQAQRLASRLPLAFFVPG